MEIGSLGCSETERCKRMLSLCGAAPAGNKRRWAHSFATIVVSFLAGFFVSSFSSTLLNCKLCPPIVLSASTARASSYGGSSSVLVERVLNAGVFRFRINCRKPMERERVREFLMEKLYDGTSPFRDFPPPYAKPWLRSKRIKGWGSYSSVFEKLIKEVQPAVILELGTFTGASAIHMANVCKKQAPNTTTPLILCVDDFRGWPALRQKFHFHQDHGDISLLFQFIQNALAMGVSDALLPLPFSTAAALDALCEWGIYADLVEVDAAHDFHSAWADINRGYALLNRPGGVMFGHDYFTKVDNGGVGRAVDLFAQMNGLWVEPHGQHWILRGGAPSSDEAAALHTTENLTLRRWGA